MSKIYKQIDDKRRPGHGPLDTKEAAEYLGLSKYTLEAWRCRGGGPRYVKYPHAVRYLKTDLDNFLCERGRSNTSEAA